MDNLRSEKAVTADWKGSITKVQKDLFEIPQLLFFESKNIWSGSVGKFNYKIFPNGETMTTHVWYGSLCMEKSDLIASKDFPVSSEGKEQMIDWLHSELKKFDLNYAC